MSKLSKYITILVSVGFIVPLVGISKIGIVMSSVDSILSWKPIVAATIGTLPIYLLDRIRDPEEDQLNARKLQRRKIVEEYRNVLIAISAVCLISYTCLSLFYNPIIQSVVLHIHILIFILYPLSKRFVFIDTMLVGIAWSTFLLSVAVFYAEGVFRISIFISMFLMKIGETELSNIRDIDADTEAGNPTLAAMLGPRKTIIFVVFCFYTSLIPVLYYIPLVFALCVGAVSMLLPVVLFGYEMRTERIMYWDRIFKLIIGLICILSVILVGGL